MDSELKVKRFVTELGAFAHTHRTESGSGSGNGGGGGSSQWTCLPVLCLASDRNPSSSPSSSSSRHAVSLGSHLMGTFKLLEAQGCDDDVCVAGGLHSVYGTHHFKSISLQPNEENRQHVRNSFGEKAERLVFLFHVSNRPAGLERGDLRDRCDRNIPIPVSAWELHELRLIEAANLLDQYIGAMEDRLKHLATTFPVLSACWLSQLRVHKLHLACAPARDATPPIADTPRWYTRWLDPSHPREPKRSLRLTLHPCAISSALYTPTPVHAAFDVDVDVRVRVHEVPPCRVLCVDQLEKRLRKVFSAPRHSQFVYVLHGEAVWGMPWSPLASLGHFLRCRCASPAIARNGVAAGGRLALDVCLAPSLPPLALALPSPSPSVPLDEVMAQSSAARALLHALHTRGYAVVRLSAPQTHAVHTAYTAMHTLVALSRASSDERTARGLCLCRAAVEGGRYVGFSQDGGRAWVQLREVLGEPRGAPAGARSGTLAEEEARRYWMQFAGPGPAPAPAPGSAAALLADMLRCTLRLQAAARALLCALGETLGLPRAELQALLRDPGSEGHCHTDTDTQDDRRAGFGASVHRVYAYHRGTGGGSGLHADMGLLTLSPRASRPALCVHRPGDLHPQRPEHAAGADEAVVFVGELLAFVTGGWLPAALHAVPPPPPPPLAGDDPDGDQPRLSMPFFLRPHPAACLVPHCAHELDATWTGADHAPTPRRCTTEAVPVAVPVAVFLQRHALALRPWRLGATSTDY